MMTIVSTIMMEIRTSPSLNISISICKRSSLPTEYSKRVLLKIDEDDGRNCEHNPNQGLIMIILREQMISAVGFDNDHLEKSILRSGIQMLSSPQSFCMFT